MEAEAFGLLLNAFQNAEREGLAECVLVRVNVKEGETLQFLSEKIYKHLRQTDIMGLSDDGLMILLSNTSPSDAEFVKDRFDKLGIDTETVEDGIVCLRPDRVS